MAFSKPVIIGMLATLISIGGAIAYNTDRQNKIAEKAIEEQKQEQHRKANDEEIQRQALQLKNQRLMDIINGKK
jgi:hypothetical protein